jgi:hypothetical protein
VAGPQMPGVSTPQTHDADQETKLILHSSTWKREYLCPLAARVLNHGSRDP